MYTYIVPVPIVSVDVTSPTTSLVIVTENVATAFVCETSPSRPQATIEWWYKTPGDGRDAEAIPGGVISLSGSGAAIITRSTLHYIPARSDHDYRVYCTAYNINKTLLFTSTRQPQLLVQYEPTITPIDDVISVEGRTATLSCEASSRPPSLLTWKRDWAKVAEGTGTSNNNKYDYVIQDVDRGQDGTYTCTADNGVGTADIKTANLAVYYAPNITVTTSPNTIQEHQSLHIDCSAAGKPTNYSYKGFTQTWRGTTIIQYPGNSVAVTSLGLENSGTYTCIANNGVPDRDGTVDQSGSNDVMVKVSPKILATQDEFHGSLGDIVNVTIPFYSHSPYISLEIKRQGTPVTGNNRITIDTTAARVTDTFFGTRVFIDGYIVTLTISNPIEMDFSNYTIDIQNDVGTVTWPFWTSLRSSPDPPLKFRIIGTSNIVPAFVWQSGFNGGYQQTFIIEVTKEGTNKWTEARLVVEDSQTHIIQNGLYATGVEGLGQGVYTSRIYSRNELGRSDYSKLLPTFTISPTIHPPVDQDRHVSTGAITGGVVAGIEAIIIVVIVVLLFRLRKQSEKDTCTVKQTGDTAERVQMSETRVSTQHYDNIGTDAVPPAPTEDEKPNVYETLDPELRSGELYDTPEPKLDQHGEAASQEEYVNMTI